MNARKLLSALTLAILFFSTVSIPLFAQYVGNSHNNSNDHNRSILFGSDVILNDQPIQNQRNVVVRAAFNGWLYAGYTFIDDIWHYPVITIMKSENNGISWSKLIEKYQVANDIEITSLDFVVVGDSVTNIKLFLAYMVVLKNQSSGVGTAYVLRCDAITGQYEANPITVPQAYDIALASDCMFPAVNSNPFSIGCIASCHSVPDTIYYYSSNNGGLSFSTKMGVAGTPNRFGKVALTYGRSLTENTGRYFAAWEEKPGPGANLGRIYTAHSEPNFNSGFTTPISLDTLIPGGAYNVRNPSISCQYGNFDNDSSNFTEVILFDRYVSGNNYEVVGLYNMKATISNHFTPFTVSSSADSKMQPSVAFNPFDSTFMVTYFNETSQKLPFLRKDLNMQNPSA